MVLAKILSIACIALFSLLGFYLIFRGRSTANTFLGTFFLLWAVNFLDGILLLDGFFLQYPFLAFWEDPFIFLHGPVIYFYTLSLSRKNNSFTIRSFWHLLPFLFFTGLLVVSFHAQPLEIKEDIILRTSKNQQSIGIGIAFLIAFVHLFVYIYFSKRELANLDNQLKAFYSSVTATWFDKTLNFIIVILGISLITSYFQFFGTPLLFDIGMFVLVCTILLFVSQILFKALDEPRIFEPPKSIDQVSIQSLEKISEKIQHFMVSESPYLDPEMTLEQLANAIQEETRLVSQAINQYMEKNFFDYVNTYRIDKAKELIQKNEDPKQTILEVMFAAGFNSKSSFNTQFKQKTGLTPSEYKKQFKK